MSQALKDSVAANIAAVEKLIEDHAAQAKEIVALNSNIVTLESDKAGLVASNDALSAQVADLTGQVSTLQAGVDPAAIADEADAENDLDAEALKAEAELGSTDSSAA